MPTTIRTKLTPLHGLRFIAPSDQPETFEATVLTKEGILIVKDLNNFQFRSGEYTYTGARRCKYCAKKNQSGWCTCVLLNRVVEKRKFRGERLRYRRLQKEIYIYQKRMDI